MNRVLFAPRELPPLPPDAAHDLERYEAWVTARERERIGRAKDVAHPPLHLVMPVGDASALSIRRTLASLRKQTSRHWSLTVGVSEQRRAEVAQLVRSCFPWWSWRRRPRISQTHAAAANELLRQALRQPMDTALALVFPGDVWAADTVVQLGAALGPRSVVYADEDSVTPDGSHAAPRLKPGYSPDFLVSSGYVGRPLAIGAELLDTWLDLTATDPTSLEHECALRACKAADSVIHLPEVLCHRSCDPSPHETSSSAEYLSRFVSEQGDAEHVRGGPWPGTFTVERTPPHEARISVVIPFRDQPQLLRTCVDSLRATTDGHPPELVLVDNGSSDPETWSLVEALEKDPQIVVLRDPRPFNWAALNNSAVGLSRGDVLVFLNNDIEAHRSGWLSALCAHALRPDIGAVGARLLYPDGRLQHCGVVVGLGGAAGHPLVGLSGEMTGYLGLATTTRECSAVTGACLATRREIFEELGGFDESLGVDLNDIDYCLRAGAMGYRTVFEPAAELTHHESPSRGTAGGVGDIVRFIERWRDYITQGDPYFNPHLTRVDASCGLTRPGEEEIWSQWYSTVTLN